MDLKKFLGMILPSTGDYFAAKVTPTGQWRQQKFPSLNAALTGLHNFINARVDTYIAIASFSGKRQIADVQLKRAWYVDIDCKPGGQYATKAEGLKAIKAALKAGLPKPTFIIDSGNGFHLYWCSEVELPKEPWTEINVGLIAACGKYNLKIDVSVTQDLARVMRVPGSSNYKDPEQPKPCTFKYDKGPIYNPDTLRDRVAVEKPLGPTLAIPGVADDDNLITESASAGPPPAAAMLEACPLFKAEMANHGAGRPGEVWHKLIHTLAYTSDGHDYIHEISKAHTDYTKQRTEGRWNIATESKNRKGMGATLCKTFAKIPACVECQTCDMRDAGKSPVSLAYKQAHDPELPYPFRNSPPGLEVYDHDSEEWVLVYPAKLTGLDASVELGIATYVEFTLGSRQLQLEMADLSDFRTCFTVFTKYGIHLKRWQYERFNELVSNFMSQLHQSKKLAKTIRSYGWVDDGFHFDGRVHGSKEPRHSIRVDHTLASIYRSKGDPAVWTECANYMLGQPREASWVVLASAFAAPLMKFTKATGALLSLVSAGSGTGKTTALKTAQAVWGNPSEGVAHLNDTPNSVENRLGVLNNLPSYWDEIRGKDDTPAFTKMLFRLSQGKEKQRLTSNITQRRSGSWSTLMTIATNEPIRDHIAQTVGNSDAGMARVFEIRARTINDKEMNDAQARHFYGRLDENFGAVGTLYAEWLGNNFVTAKTTVEHIDKQLCKRFNTTGDERYWIAVMSVLIAGAQFANNLNLADFPVKKMSKYLAEQFLSQRTIKAEEFAVGQNMAMQVLRRFLHEKTEYTVVADNLPGRGGNTTNIVRQEPLRRPAVVRIALKAGAARIILEDFKQWVYDRQGAGSSQIIEDLINMGAKKTRGSVDAGSAVGASQRQYCLDITFSGSFRDLGSSISTLPQDSTDDSNPL